MDLSWKASLKQRLAVEYSVMAFWARSWISTVPKMRLATTSCTEINKQVSLIHRIMVKNPIKPERIATTLFFIVIICNLQSMDRIIRGLSFHSSKQFQINDVKYSFIIISLRAVMIRVGKNWQEALTTKTKLYTSVTGIVMTPTRLGSWIPNRKRLKSNLFYWRNEWCITDAGIMPITRVKVILLWQSQPSWQQQREQNYRLEMNRNINMIFDNVKFE